MDGIFGILKKRMNQYYLMKFVHNIELKNLINFFNLFKLIDKNTNGKYLKHPSK